MILNNLNVFCALNPEHNPLMLKLSLCYSDKLAFVCWSSLSLPLLTSYLSSPLLPPTIPTTDLLPLLPSRDNINPLQGVVASNSLHSPTLTPRATGVAFRRAWWSPPACTPSQPASAQAVDHNQVCMMASFLSRALWCLCSEVFSSRHNNPKCPTIHVRGDYNYYHRSSRGGGNISKSKSTP